MAKDLNGVQAIEQAGCGCAVQEGSARRALEVEPTVKARSLNRLKRIEGQVRGLQRMVEGERYCADILTQLSSVQHALRAVGKELLRNHLRHCATSAIRRGGRDADAMYDELVALMDRHG